MRPWIDRWFVSVVVLVAMSGACLACGGEGEAGQSESEGAATETDAGDESAAAETTGDTEASSTPDDGDAAPTCMLGVFRRLEAGDWVRTLWTNKEEHTLLVASKTDKMITIEEIVEDRGFRKAWTQLDVSLADGTLLALRERLADGTIEAHEPAAEAQRGTSDLLLEPFRSDGRDEQRARIEVHAAGGGEPTILRGRFFCRRYKVTVEEGRYAHVWFSRVKLPDYPIKIHYYEENLTIELKAFGTGRDSAFAEKPEPRRRGRQRTD